MRHLWLQVATATRTSTQRISGQGGIRTWEKTTEQASPGHMGTWTGEMSRGLFVFLLRSWEQIPDMECCAVTRVQLSVCFYYGRTSSHTCSTIYPYPPTFQEKKPSPLAWYEIQLACQVTQTSIFICSNSRKCLIFRLRPDSLALRFPLKFNIPG